MAIAQRPLVTKRDMLKIFGEDRLVAVIRTATPELAERAARAVAEAGVRLVEITLTVPDAIELIAKLALDLGADFIKIYPVATVGGPAYVANVRRALQLLPLVVTGNIEYDEIPQYLKVGVVGFGIGGPLIPADDLGRGDHAALVANARRFLAATRA